MNKVKEWITDLRENESDPKPFLIFYGTAGVGKTTLAHLILQKYGYEIIECNASDTRSKKQIRETIGSISSVSVCVDNKNNFKKTAIIMDEIDGLNSVNESSGIQELVDIIISNNKKTKETKWTCPVICTSNSIKDKKLQIIIRYGVLLHIDRPTINDMNKLINRITKSEQFEIDNEVRNIIIKKANGDYRQVILLLNDYYNDLKIIKTKNTEIKIEEYDPYKEEDEHNQTVIRDIDCCGDTPLDKINYFLTHTSDMDIIRYFCSGDSNLYFMNFYHNTISVLSTIQEKMKEPKNKDTFLKAYHNLIKVYNSIKIADLMNNSIFLDKNWELLDYFDIFSVSIPSQIINKINNQTTVSGVLPLVKEFALSHHSPYNFMRQEQSMNRKLLNSDYVKIFDTNITNIYYNLKRFQNSNDELIKKNSKGRKKPTNTDDSKYVIDKSYLKILDKINELLA